MKIALTGGAGIQAMSAMIYLLDQKNITDLCQRRLQRGLGEGARGAPQR